MFMKIYESYGYKLEYSPYINYPIIKKGGKKIMIFKFSLN